MPSTVTCRRSAASSSSSSPASSPGTKRLSLFTSNSEEAMQLFLVVDNPAAALDAWARWADEVERAIPLCELEQVTGGRRGGWTRPMLSQPC